MQIICSTVRHCWKWFTFPSQRKPARIAVQVLPTSARLHRVKLSTGHAFLLKRLSFYWRGILQINLQALQINFLLGFITLFSQADLMLFRHFFFLFQTRFKVLVLILKQYGPLCPPFSQYLKPHTELWWYLYFLQEYLGINSYEKHYPRAPALQIRQYRPSLSEYTASI